ncbi:MAG: NAD(P)/FAD-dependent oxidoreductase [Betaproteobacteria bacterium]
MLLDQDRAHDQDPPGCPGGRMTVRVDVLCVGLGPAGARAAWGAAARGLDVLAIDRKPAAGVPVQCAEFVPSLLGAEVAQVARSTRQRIDAMDSYVERAPADRTKPFPGRMIDRAAFDAALVDDAIEAGAQCRFGVSVRAIAVDGVVTLSDGVRVAPRVLVGADGPRSAVGRAIGQVNRALVETRQVTVPLLAPHDATDIFLSASIPGGYAWLFPKAQVANLGAGVEPTSMHALKDIVARLHARLVAERRVGREILAITGGAIPAGGALVPRGRLGQAAVMLAGDAAGLANPVTGAGIAAAVQSGTLAGEYAAAELEGRRDALADYESELEALFGASLRRALQRREERLRADPCPASLRRAWIAYAEYWMEGAQA